MKEIFTAVAASILTAIVLYLAGIIGKVPSMISVPSGAVVAFHLEACPDDSWREYKEAYGRFIRGIDKSGNSIDPAGERIPGNIQNDSLSSHTHSITLEGAWGDKMGHKTPAWGGDDGPQKTALTQATAATGGEETRSKNVALLFCIKK